MSVSPLTSACGCLGLWGIAVAWIIKIHRIGSGHGPVKSYFKGAVSKDPSGLV